MALDVIWEGLGSKAWSYDELGWLGERLGEVDVADEYLRAMRLEMIASLEMYEWAKRGHFRELAGLIDGQYSGERRRALDLFPSGWFDQIYPDWSFAR